jgi:hypothetical protein
MPLVDGNKMRMQFKIFFHQTHGISNTIQALAINRAQRMSGGDAFVF